MASNSSMTRRNFLRATLLAGAATGLLAACGGGTTPQTAPTTAPQASNQATPTKAAATGNTPAAANTPAAGNTPAAANTPAAGTTPAAATPAAAGTPTAASTGSTGGSNMSGTLTWSFWGDPNELPPNDKVIAAFNQKYPNIKIDKFHEPWASYFDKIQARFAGGNPPDVLFLTNVPVYAAQNVLQPLDDYIQRDHYSVDDFVPASLELFKNNNQIFGFPRDNDTQVLYYNKDMLDKASIKYPDANWTLDNLRDAANKLSVREGSRVSTYGAAIESGRWNWFVWTNGGEVFDNNRKPTKCTLDTPEATSGIQYLADLMNKDKSIPSSTGLDQFGGVTDMFPSGRAAMVVSNAPRLLTFKNAKFKWNIAVLPHSKVPVNYVGGAGYVQAKATKNPDLAWVFTSFVNGPEAQNIFSQGGGVVPARISVQKNGDWIKSAPEGVDMNVFVTATSQGHAPQLIGPWQTELNNILTKGLDTVWAGERSAADAVKDIVAQENAKIKDLVK